MSEATTTEAERALESFRKQVRAEAMRVARDNSWCEAGLNATLERLGLPPKGPAYTVPVRYTSRTPHERTLTVSLPSEAVAGMAEAAGKTAAQLVADYYGGGGETSDVQNARIDPGESVRAALPIRWDRFTTRITTVLMDDADSEADARAHAADDLDLLASKLGMPREYLISAEVPEVKENPEELVKGDLDTSYDNYRQCEHHGPDGVYCTRARAHDGQHVGSSGHMTEVLAVWPQLAPEESPVRKTRAKSRI